MESIIRISEQPLRVNLVSSYESMQKSNIECQDKNVFGQ